MLKEYFNFKMKKKHNERREQDLMMGGGGGDNIFLSGVMTHSQYPKCYMKLFYTT